MLRGQVAVALGRAGEVGVQAAAGGADVAAGALQQPGGAEPGEGAEPVPGGAVLVDVEDVGAGGAGGDGQVPAALPAEPFGDPLLCRWWRRGSRARVAGIFWPGRQGNTGQPRSA